MTKFVRLGTVDRETKTAFLNGVIDDGQTALASKLGGEVQPVRCYKQPGESQADFVVVQPCH